jgi:hypothetical protein
MVPIKDWQWVIFYLVYLGGCWLLDNIQVSPCSLFALLAGGGMWWIPGWRLWWDGNRRLTVMVGWCDFFRSWSRSWNSLHPPQPGLQWFQVIIEHRWQSSTTPRDVTGDEPSSTSNRLSTRFLSWIHLNRTVTYLFIHWIWTHGKDGEWNVFALKGNLIWI